MQEDPIIRAITPSDCLLITGLPQNRESFDASLSEQRSFANTFAPVLFGRPLPGTAFLDESSKLISKIQKLGCKVIPGNSPKDELRKAVSGATVVTFWTHTLWNPYLSGDVTDPAELAEALRTGDGSAARSFRDWFLTQPEVHCYRQKSIPDQVVIKYLELGVRLAHDYWCRFPSEKKKEDLPRPEDPAHGVIFNLSRPVVDHDFGRWIKTDRGIEIGGQMCSAGELFQNLGNGRAKVFDLRMCTSGMLTRTVRHYYPPPNRLVTCQFLTSVMLMLVQYETLLHILRRGRLSYAQALEKILNANSTLPLD